MTPMTIDVNVLRVFTDADGKFGNPLGVVSAGAVPSADRQRIATELGYSETAFIEDPMPGFGSARVEIFTPALELLFAGDSAVGAAWWLRDLGTPIRNLQLHAGVVEVHYTGDLTTVEMFAEWTPEFALHEFNSPHDVTDADPGDFSRWFSALPVGVGRRIGWAHTISGLRAGAGCGGGRGDQCCCDTHHGLSEPRSHHHSGQGFGDLYLVETQRVGSARWSGHSRRAVAYYVMRAPKGRI